MLHHSKSEFEQFFNQQGEPRGNYQTLRPLVPSISEWLWFHFNKSYGTCHPRGLPSSESHKLVLAISYVSEDKQTGEYSFYTSSNTRITLRPQLIQNRQDLINILNFFAVKDVCPYSKWQLERSEK